MRYVLLSIMTHVDVIQEERFVGAAQEACLEILDGADQWFIVDERYRERVLELIDEFAGTIDWDQKLSGISFSFEEVPIPEDDSKENSEGKQEPKEEEEPQMNNEPAPELEKELSVSEPEVVEPEAAQDEKDESEKEAEVQETGNDNPVEPSVVEDKNEENTAEVTDELIEEPNVTETKDIAEPSSDLAEYSGDESKLEQGLPDAPVVSDAETDAKEIETNVIDEDVNTVAEEQEEQEELAEHSTE